MKKTDYLSTLFVGIDIGSRTNVLRYIIKCVSLYSLQQYIVPIQVSEQ